MTPQQEVHRLLERFNQLCEKLPKDSDYLNDLDRVEEVTAIMIELETLNDRAEAIMEQQREIVGRPTTHREIGGRPPTHREPKPEPTPKPKPKFNLVLLDLDHRFTSRVSKRQRAERKAAMQRVRRWRERRKTGASILANVVVRDEIGLAELLIRSGLLQRSDSDNREAIAKAAGRFLDLAVREEHHNGDAQ